MAVYRLHARHYDQTAMNPSTILRLWSAFENRPSAVLHVLEIGAVSGCWPQTVYKATFLGYLKRTELGRFKATNRMMEEVRRVERLRHLA